LKTWAVAFQPEAQNDLDTIERLIAARDTPEAAAAYIERVITFCETLRHFPERGAARDDLGPGVRLIGFEKRISIVVRLRNDEVRVVRVFYAGQAIALGRG
jgi:toxin ParE1/3/4